MIDLKPENVDFSAESLPTLVDQAKRAIDEAKTFEEVKNIRDQAEALRVYTKKIGAGLEAQNRCAEIKLRGRASGPVKSFRSSRWHLVVNPTGRMMTPVDRYRPSRKIGINKSQSSRWQAIARLPEEEFETFITDGSKRGRELTSSDALKLAKTLQKIETAEQNRTQSSILVVDDLLDLIDHDMRFGAILADPPWRFETRSEKGTGRSADQHYGTMDLAGICALGEYVDRLAAENAVLFLWVIDPMLPPSPPGDRRLGLQLPDGRIHLGKNPRKRKMAHGHGLLDSG